MVLLDVLLSFEIGQLDVSMNSRCCNWMFDEPRDDVIVFFKSLPVVQLGVLETSERGSVSYPCRTAAVTGVVVSYCR